MPLKKEDTRRELQQIPVAGMPRLINDAAGGMLRAGKPNELKQGDAG